MSNYFQGSLLACKTRGREIRCVDLIKRGGATAIASDKGPRGWDEGQGDQEEPGGLVGLVGVRDGRLGRQARQVRRLACTLYAGGGERRKSGGA